MNDATAVSPADDAFEVRRSFGRGAASSLGRAAFYAAIGAMLVVTLPGPGPWIALALAWTMLHWIAFAALQLTSTNPCVRSGPEGLTLRRGPSRATVAWPDVERIDRLPLLNDRIGLRLAEGATVDAVDSRGVSLAGLATMASTFLGVAPIALLRGKPRWLAYPFHVHDAKRTIAANLEMTGYHVMLETTWADLDADAYEARIRAHWHRYGHGPDAERAATDVAGCAHPPLADAPAPVTVRSGRPTSASAFRVASYGALALALGTLGWERAGSIPFLLTMIAMLLYVCAGVARLKAAIGWRLGPGGIEATGISPPVRVAWTDVAGATVEGRHVRIDLRPDADVDPDDLRRLRGRRAEWRIDQRNLDRPAPQVAALIEAFRRHYGAPEAPDGNEHGTPQRDVP